MPVHAEHLAEEGISNPVCNCEDEERQENVPQTQTSANVNDVTEKI